ncbi:SEC14-like protein 2 [Amphiura filiformis]|uniref:SEC14-like protein 2 n=1 Tax=Amphiura filiformis TaxID=82378 RepID=UPI003B2159FD
MTKFKENLQDVLETKHDDYCLLRFLRAREFDLQKSEYMFRQDIEWRAKTKIDTLVDDYKAPEVCEKYWAGGVLDGYDKEQGPIWILPAGTIDPKGLLYSCKTRDILTFLYMQITKLVRNNETRCKQACPRIDWGTTVIFDAEGIGLRHLWKPFIDVVTEILSTGELHYPETGKRIFIIKAPAIFPVAFSLCKPFLKEHTKEKIKVLGGNWKEVVLEHIDADVLPVHWGGTKTDPDGDPKCPSMIKPGGEVPKSYYKNVDRFEDDTKYITKDISRGAVHEVAFDVSQRGSLLRYLFKSNGHDISFGINYIDAAGKRTSILEIKRYNSHMVPEDGEMELERPGKYIMVFDNSYSWTRGKRISYWLEIVEPSLDLMEGDDDTDFLQAVIQESDP